MKKISLFIAVVLVCCGGLLSAGVATGKGSAAFEPLIVAHRGASKDAPENTIAAFEVPEKEYRLIGSSGKKLEFSQRAGHGSYSFHYNNGDIEKIRVLTKQLY